MVGRPKARVLPDPVWSAIIIAESEVRLLVAERMAGQAWDWMREGRAMGMDFVSDLNVEAVLG